VIAWALEPLLEVWNESLERQDQGLGEAVLISPARDLPRASDLYLSRGPGISAYPGRTGGPRQQVTSGPLARPRRLPRIWNLSDAQLSRLWPGIDPQDVRRWAPWAVTREEVARLALPAGSPLPEAAELEARVQAAIRAERLAFPAPEEVEIVPRRRPPGAFKLRELRQATRTPHPPVVFDAYGRPLGPPPRATRVTKETIRRSLRWAELALGSIVREENIAPLLDRSGRQVVRHTTQELSRVLKVNLRENIPGLQGQIDDWRRANVGLIETGVRASQEAVKLRPSLLGDVSRTVEELHTKGIRVEAVAGELRRRFGVSDSRAELIARDQVLKLNGQINRSRQRAVGIQRYQWVTSRDERVRETHAELDGSTQSWDSPPEVGEGRNEHPGGDYQCRCIAVPLPPAWMQE
jgi:SPP1 gp7 family putative phage head morphogenesis protein